MYNGSTWATGATTNASMTVAQSGQIELKGNDADIKINGKSLKEAIENIEQRLNLLTVDVELEAEWSELKELGERYRALEKEIKAKMKTWDILKNQD
jgi:flagellar motility protein MotE (MotC chaperone)